jgi:autotransporter-associated beta strand protein
MMRGGFGFLRRVTETETRCRKNSRKRAPVSFAPYLRRLRIEPLEERRLLTTPPTISGVIPAFPVATGSPQQFTINGSDFQSGCTVTLLDLGTGISYPNRTISSQTSTQIVINPNFGTTQDVWGVQVVNPFFVTSTQFDFAVTPASLPQPNRFGVDYSFARPAPATLKASGSTFAVRYVSPPPNNKNISLSEAQSLQAAGQEIILVFESTATEMLNGFSAGVADANTAVSVATAAGAPANFFCYFAADFDASANDQIAINQYLGGAASVMGRSRVGIYGGYYTVSQVLSAGMASKGWQTVAWSGGNQDSRISLFQYAIHILGTSCDVDVGFGTNLGQWTPPTPSGLTASATGIQSISIGWNTAYVTTSYTLDRATSSSGPWTPVYSGAATQYADGGLQFGTNYYYKVCANNGGGSSAFSSSVSATTLSGVPTGLAATATGPQSISLGWNTVTGAAAYTLQRSTSQDGPWTQIYSDSSPQFSDTACALGTTYFYEVRSGTSTGSSAYSSPASATTWKTMTWTGGGTNANWSSAANWGGAAPVAGCDLVFAGSTGLNNSNDIAAGTQFGNLTFNAGAGAFILNGNSLNLSGTITNNSANTQTINVSLDGTNGLAKTGPGTVMLSAANSFTGGTGLPGSTVVTGGTLQVATPAALPDGSNLSIGANVLTAFAAPVVGWASEPVRLSGTDLEVHPTIAAVAPAASNDRSLSVRDKAIQAALAGARWRTAAWVEEWANWPPFHDPRDRTIPPLAAHDAVLADYSTRGDK